MNKALLLQRSRTLAENATGLAFVVSETSEGVLEYRPGGLLPGQAFNVPVELGLNRLQLRLQFENYSEDIKAEMLGAGRGKLNHFFYALKNLRDCGCTTVVKIDDRQVNNADEWPDGGKRLLLESASGFLQTDDEDEFITACAGLIAKFILLPVLLLDLENEGEEMPEALPEGALTVVQVNKYERSRINRQLCIDKHGSACAACGFDFEEHYGEAGTGFIEVHHILPVSEMGEDYTPDPETELVPLCSNCHSIVHRRKPPFTIDEIRSMLKK